MALLSIIGSKGGVGTSLVATNLGCALAHHKESTLLIDFHVGVGVDDLLIGSSVQKDWGELFAVLDELKPKHVDLTTGEHPCGLQFMQGPERETPVEVISGFPKLVRAVSSNFRWCLVDLPVELSLASKDVLSSSDVVLLITTTDPPALRCADRFAERLPGNVSTRTGVVINQIARQHPSTPERIAASLGLPLLASLPPDPYSIGRQVHFGQTCALDRESSFGRGIRRLARRLEKSSEGMSRQPVGSLEA